jgi:ribonuclease-3
VGIIPLLFLRNLKDNSLFFPSFFSSKSELDKQLSGYLKEFFGFSPYHLQLFKQALIHKSVTKNRTAGVRHSNERLEFLGDAILDAVIGDFLYKKFPDKNEGFLTKARSKLVSRTHLIHLAKSTGLEKHIVCDINDDDVRLSLAGNAMEAIMGAMYLRKGYNFTHDRILQLIERFTNVEDFISRDEDYKSLVYQWTQKNKKTLDFKSVELDSKSLFEVSLFIDSEFIAKATGPNIKTADQKVSKLAIKLLKIK